MLSHPAAETAYDELHADSANRSHAIARSWIDLPSDPHVVNEAEANVKGAVPVTACPFGSFSVDARLKLLHCDRDRGAGPRTQ